MTVSSTFTFHTDPGHGWLEVTFNDLSAVGVTLNQISKYSYADSRNGRLYLEEDCDAAIFIAAFVEKHGEVPTLTERYAEHTFVRRLPSIALLGWTLVTA
jgi:hypothetical protein